MKLLGVVVVCGLATMARADTIDPFATAHGRPVSGDEHPSLDRPDPFAYAHGLPRAGEATPEPTPYRGLGAESVSPELVAKHAPPPLDPAVSRHVQALLDVRGTDGGLVTLRGDRMYFTWRITGTAQVWRQDGPKAFPVQLTGGEDSTTAVGLAPDDSFVVVSRDIGGAENPGLYVMAPDGGPLRLIQHAPKVQTELAFISDDAKAIFFRANDRDPGSYAIYRFDVKTGAKELVFDQPGLWAVIDHRGTQWLLANELGNARTEIATYDVTTKQLVTVLGHGETVAYQAAFGPKAGQLIVRTNKLGEFERLYSVEAGNFTPISADVPHDITGFGLDRARRRLYYAINEGGVLRLAVQNARTGKRLDLPTLPAGETTYLSTLSFSGRFAQIAIASSTRPTTTVVFDWWTDHATEWRPPAMPELDVATVATATIETYPARDGTKIPMLVRRPAACAKAVTPCPVIVEFHGGPEGQARPMFSAAAQLYVDAGFVIVQPNVRGSTGYGKAWLHADDGPKRLDVITDIEDCAVYLRTAWAKAGVAPKLGVLGSSYGGYSVLMAMTRFAGAYDAGVEQVGISNLGTFLANTAPYRRILRISEYGDPVKDKVALAKLSPITYVDRIRAPLLIFQGVNDPRVPVGEALQFYGALETSDIEGGLILFPDEGHGASKRSNVVLTLGHSLEFFKEHLK